VIIAHLTDIHVAHERDYPSPAEAAWHPKLRKHSEELLQRLLVDLAAQDPDHVILTGDLTMTSKEEEFARARAYLDRLLPGRRISVIPGNHDRWSAEAEAPLQQHFGDWMRCDLGRTDFPYCHLVDGVAIVALDSSPFVAGEAPADVKGFVDAEQLDELLAIAATAEVSARFLIVLLHHHLRLSAEDALVDDPKDPTPLVNAPEVEEALGRIPVDLVLHGHRHKQMRLDLSLGDRVVPVLCPGSATRVDERPSRTGRYGLYTVEGGALGAVRHRVYEPARDAFVWG